jgi:nitrogen fixation/metabolism regulation signal transduction histidine kinase
MSTDEVAFMGRITAGMTHELRNVLAVIGESAGLMEDLLAISGSDSSRYREKFGSIITRILNQVQRGTVLAAGLSRFAHCPESRGASLDLNEILEQLATVTAWLGREKRVSLRLRQAEPVKLAADPVKVQMLVFAALEAVVSLAPQVQSVELTPVKSGNGAAVEMALEASEGDLSRWERRIVAWPGWSGARELADSFGARLELDSGGPVLRVLFEPMKHIGT